MLLCVGECGTSIIKLGSKYSSYKIRSFFIIDVDNIPWSHLYVLFYLFHLMSSLSLSTFMSFFLIILDSAHETKHASCLAESGLFTYLGVSPTPSIFIQMTKP